MTDDGKLLLLGDTIQISKRTSPEIVEIEDNLVKSVALGYKHSVILTENGKVFAFGDNFFNQFNE